MLVPGFSPPQKTNVFKFQFDQDRGPALFLFKYYKYLFIYLPSLLLLGKTFVIPLRKAIDIPTVSEMEEKNVLDSTAGSQNQDVKQEFDEQGNFYFSLPLSFLSLTVELGSFTWLDVTVGVVTP